MGINISMKYKYYEKTFNRYAIYTRDIDSKDFIPLHNEFIDKEFKVIEWDIYGEAFGAPSRNRT